MTSGSVYYAHAKPIYGTSAEKKELALITKKFKGREIINPSLYNNHPEKRRDTMAFCFKLVDDCKLLVFSKWNGVITSGVGQEANYALKQGKEVFELVSSKFISVTKPVVHKSFEETIRLYYGDTFLTRLSTPNSSNKQGFVKGNLKL